MDLSERASDPQKTAAQASTPSNAALLNPPLQRAPGLIAQAMSTIDDGYDSDTMAKIDANIRKQCEAVKSQCFKQIETRIQETNGELFKRMDSVEMSYKSQITET